MLNLVANGPSGYNLTNSLRFRASASAYLTRTPASATNQKTYTWSAWVKRGNVDTSTYKGLFQCGNTWFAFNTSNGLEVNLRNGATNYITATTPVYRDPSAWYHIVIVVDTTQATSANRLKFYVNNTQITAFSATNIPAQNFDTQINSTTIHYLGSDNGSSSDFFDGYMTEINFIDGQALTPSSFGNTNSTTGVWQPAKYTGTYGTNGFYLQMNANNNPMTAATVNTISTYQASFSGSSQNVTSPTTGSVYAFGTGDFTIETFVKWNTVGTALFAGNIDNSGYGDWAFFYNSSIGVLRFLYNNGTGPISSSSWTPTTNTWYHLALVRNSGTLTFYVNGVSYGSTALATSLTWSSSTFYMGTTNDLSLALNGYMSNLRVVKGTAVYTSAFTPPTSALTNISGTSILTFQNSTVIDNSSNNFTLTKNNVPIYVPDSSSNGNTWIGNNISLTAGTTYDLMTDVPTLTSATVANYAVFDATVPHRNFPVDGNLKWTGSASNPGSAPYGLGCQVNFPMSSGKWYWEVTKLGGTSNLIGILDTAVAYTGNASEGGSDGTVNSYYYLTGGGSWFSTTFNPSFGSSYATNDVIGVAYDADNNKLYFAKNGTWQASGDPSAGTNGVSVVNQSGSWVPMMSSGSYTSNSYAFNGGQRPYAYSVPTGFKALNTFNLPSSTIVQGNKYMDATLYSGNAVGLTAVNQGQFKPDLVWVKDRTSVAQHVLTDSVRGTSAQLFSSLTNAEQSNSTYVTSFNSNGFTVGVGNSGTGVVNNTGDNFVGWQWQAGQGSTSSNTSGTITSTVSVNTTAGFSVVTYTGNVTGGATVGHGLGVAPSMIITKNRDTATAWWTYHKSLGATQYIVLNTTAATVSSISAWNNTQPNANVFYLGASSPSNANQCVAYCWAEISGFSKFGSYTGNGSTTDGPFVYTGFRPKFVMIKDTTNAATQWEMLDSSRNTYNIVNSRLIANLSNAESTENFVDLLSNGFKVRPAFSSTINNSGATLIYMAFAENPFKNALAR